MTQRIALFWTLFWVISALLFNGLLWIYWYTHEMGGMMIANQKASEFFIGYSIEKILSIDNLFVFYFIFHHQFHLPLAQQRRVLVWGIWGASVLRLLLIMIGAWLVAQFNWVMPVMGLFLCVAGVRAYLNVSIRYHAEHNRLIHWVKRYLPVVSYSPQQRFFVKKNKRIYVTPLFLALILIEISDVIFALDSIPAIFAITKDPVIIWTSNIFAILGLRALYFVLVEMMSRLRFLQYGTAIILVFIGSKMLISPWVTISLGWSLGVIMSILASCVILSWW